MTTSDEPFNKSLKSEELSVPQYRLPMILFMYAWPVAWFMLLIYVIGPAFVQSDRTYPLWAYNLIGVLGNGAELLVALLIFRREGYRLTPKALRADQPALPRQAVELGGVRRRFCRGRRPGPVGRPA